MDAQRRMLPLPEVGVGFYPVLCFVVEGGVEVDAREALHVVDGAGGAGKGDFLAVVIHHEADGLGGVRAAHHHLEESVGHVHASAADGLCLGTIVIDGAADDVDGAVLTRPVAAEHLQRVPLVFVQVVVLRTDIGEEKRLSHGLCVPLVVARGAHVAAVVARVEIVVVGGAGADVGVLAEHLARALVAAVGVAFRQVPRHPVGAARLAVIRRGVALASQDLLGTVVEWCRQFVCRYLGARSLGGGTAIGFGGFPTVVEGACNRFVGIGYRFVGTGSGALAA